MRTADPIQHEVGGAMIGELASGPSGSASLFRPRGRILVVDDSEEIASLLAEMLRHEGDVIATAGDPVEALAIAEQLRPHLGLLDLRLPRMSGWELARRLRARFDGAIVLAAVTGWSSPGDRQRSTRMTSP